jgi:hypothetical protein
MKTSSYKLAIDFGSNAYSPSNNPLSYCVSSTLDSKMNHGSQANILEPEGRSCQLFMSEYCAEKWDGFCEVVSRNTNKSFPNNYNGVPMKNTVVMQGLTTGDVLVRNTAARKYLVKMHNAHKIYEPFDPTVPTSPMISWWKEDGCCSGDCSPGTPEFSVDPSSIDDDPVMNRILLDPKIAMDILINIYNSMKRKDTLHDLKNTKLGHFYNFHPYFKSKGGC